MILELEKKIFYQMPLIVSVSINFSGILGCNATWDYDNTATAFDPLYKFVAVIAFIGYYQFSSQIKGFKQLFCKANVITIAA